MAGRKPDLYRWEKFSKPRVYSRTQKVTSNNDIQDWIKKVEEASDNAAAAAFGKPAKRGAREARVKVEDAQLHDAAYAEAQDLLQQWVDEKLDLDDTDLSFEAEPWAARSNPKKSPTDIRREWDNLIADNDEDYGLGSDLLSPKPASERSKEVYSRLLDEDSDRAVEDILQSMLDKDVVSGHVTRDLGLNERTKHVDPSTKMALRQQQVKENREKREAEKKRKLQEARSKKEAQLNAKKILQKEEAEKESRRKREESEIQREMMRIRKEMAEEQRRAEEQKRRDKQEEEKKKLAAEAELQRQRLVEAEARKQLAMEDVDRQRKIARKIQEVETRNTTQRLRLLHKYFSGWYSVVADRRLQLGKAEAMADWKLALRTFRAWRAHVITQRTDQDTQRHLEEVKELHRRSVRAEHHYRTATLRRCFAAWLLFGSLERREREVKNEQKKTKNKMASFLEAAASGALWSKAETDLRKSMSLEDVRSAGPDSTRQRVDDMFSQPARQRRGSGSARSVSSSQLTEPLNKPPGSANRKPTQAWQVTRKHLKLTKEEIANLTQGEGDGQVDGPDSGRSEGSRTTTSRAGKKPWDKKYVVNSTEHRTAAQSKILEQQQAQIKEQQRLIEELTYLQKQQMFQTQLTQQQLLRQQAPGAPPSEEQTKLEKHLKDLQANLVERGADLVPNGQAEGPGTARSDNTAASGDTNQTKNQKSKVLKVKLDEPVTDRDKAPPRTDRTDHSRTTSGGSTGRTVSSTNSKHTNFLKSMEERAAERARLKAEREEKRRKAEEERLAQLAAKAEEDQAREEEEKQRKIEEYREKKRLEKQREIEREKDAERIRQMYVTVDLHRQKALLKFRGWRPWQRLMEIARNRQIVADQHYKAQLLRKVLLGWHHTVREEVDHKEGLADHMLRYILLRRSFTNWRRVGECVAIQEEKAGRFFTGRLVARVFTAWRDHAEEEKVAMWHKERKAREHNLYRLKKRSFSALRRFPKTRKADEERERRRAEMRKKVASMLPDFDDEKKMKSSVDSDVSGFFS